MADSATPETGPEKDAATPPAPANTEAEAVSRISDLLEGRPETPAEATQTEEAQEDPQTEAPEEPEQSEPESQETAPEETEEAELPDNWADWAAEVGVDADELANYLKVNVKVNGETSLIPLSEALDGYQRLEDYKGKTEQLAEERRALEAQNQQAQTALNQQVDALGQLVGQLQAELQTTTDEDLTKILEEQGSEAYLLAKAQVDRKREALAQGQQALALEAQQMQQQYEANMVEYRNQQLEALKAADTMFADAEKGQAFVKELESFMRDSGFSDQEIQQFGAAFDHRTVLMMRDAMRYRALEKGKGEVKKLKKLPQVTKPGGPLRRKAPDSDLGDARARLRKGRGRMTRSQEDAAAVDLVKQIMGD